MVYAFAAWTANRTFGARLPPFRPSGRAVAAYLTLFVLYSVVLRNLPWPPFTWFYVDNLV